MREQRPDLIVANIDEGDEVVYNNEVTTLEVAVTQSELADSAASDVRIPRWKIQTVGQDWFQIDEGKTVGLDGETTFYEYDWTPLN